MQFNIPRLSLNPAKTDYRGRIARQSRCKIVRVAVFGSLQNPAAPHITFGGVYEAERYNNALRQIKEADDLQERFKEKIQSLYPMLYAPILGELFLEQPTLNIAPKIYDALDSVKRLQSQYITISAQRCIVSCTLRRYIVGQYKPEIRTSFELSSRLGSELSQPENTIFTSPFLP